MKTCRECDQPVIGADGVLCQAHWTAWIETVDTAIGEATKVMTERHDYEAVLDAIEPTMKVDSTGMLLVLWAHLHESDLPTMEAVMLGEPPLAASIRRTFVLVRADDLNAYAAWAKVDAVQLFLSAIAVLGHTAEFRVKA